MAGTGSEQGSREGSGSEGQHNNCRHDSHQQTGTAGCILLCTHGKSSSHIKKIQKGSGAKFIYSIRKGFLTYSMMKCAIILSYMRKGFSQFPFQISKFKLYSLSLFYRADACRWFELKVTGFLKIMKKIARCIPILTINTIMQFFS